MYHTKWVCDASTQIYHNKTKVIAIGFIPKYIELSNLKYCLIFFILFSYTFLFVCHTENSIFTRNTMKNVLMWYLTNSFWGFRFFCDQFIWLQRPKIVKYFCIIHLWWIAICVKKKSIVFRTLDCMVFGRVDITKKKSYKHFVYVERKKCISWGYKVIEDERIW